jgi:hypothetical protein
MDEFLMGHYRRNTYVVDQVSRFGQTVGMPLFEQTTPQPDAAGKERLANAPKVMELATDTQKLSHTMLKADQMRLAEMQWFVLNAIDKIGPATNEELRQYLNVGINRIVGRTFELRQLGLVISAGKRPCKVTGNVVHAWMIVKPKETNEKV